MRKIKEIFYTNRKELFLSLLTLIGFLVFIPIFTYSYFAKDLTTRDSITNKNDTGIILLDRNDKPFFTFYNAKNKTSISLSQIPKTIQESIIASEDKDFYKHSGFSYPAIIRSFLYNMSHKQTLYGGSTITQQLVKNVLLNPKKNYFRKMQEIVLAQEIEKRYSKDEILEMYLNSVYFGEGAFGIESAAQNYFDKHAKNLTLAETAFLTGILPSPSMLSPFSGDYKRAKVNQKIVLEKMYEQKYITKEEKLAAENEKLLFKPSNSDLNNIATHFALTVRDQLIKQYGEEYIARSGFRVRTTIDINWQKEAEKAVAKQVQNLKANHVSNGAAVVMDPKTGDIKALVGSSNWYDNKTGKLNMAISPRSVGSSFKPVIYSAALEERIITPATILHDTPTTYAEGYRPQNYDHKFRGPVTTRRALSNSLNVPAVEVMKKVGITNGLEMAKKLGIKSLKDPSYYGQGLSIVLGAGETSLIEITNAYATFANQGVRAEPRMILAISDKTKKQIYSSKVTIHKVLEPETAFLISSILSDKKARSEIFSNLLDTTRPAAVKTGTAESYRDALTMGYTPSLAVGVWVGNSDNTPMDTIAGSLGAAPIWKTLIDKLSLGTPVETFSPPANIVQVPTCDRKTSEYFIRGTQPLKNCYALQQPTPRLSQPPLSITSMPYQRQEEIRQRIEEHIKKIEEARKKRRDWMYN